MKKSILVGINERPGIYFAQAVSEEFDAHVVSVVLYQYIEETYPSIRDSLSKLGKYYSVPDFYFNNIGKIDAMVLSDLDRLQCELEQRLGIENSNLLVSYDRSMMRVKDYRTSRNLQVLNLMLAEKILSENDIALCSVGYGYYLWQLLMGACSDRRIPCLTRYYDRLTAKRVVSVTPDGQFRGVAETFEALMRGEKDCISTEDLKAADDYYYQFTRRPERPHFAQLRTRTVSKAATSIMRGGGNAVIKNIKMYYRNDYDRISGRLESSLESVAAWPLKLFNMLMIQKGIAVNGKPDLSRKYIYLPLHFKPEITDMFYGSQYDHHEGFVTQLAKRIPSEYCLYVKEHTSMIGRRPLSFYRNLNKLHNVEMVSPGVSTFDLIFNGVTLAITGTAGWEAYLLGRPSIVLGNVFYNRFPGVLRANMWSSDFTLQVKQYLTEFRHAPDECIAAVRACMANSTLVDKDFDVTSEASFDQNARHSVRAWHKLIQKWFDLDTLKEG